MKPKATDIKSTLKAAEDFVLSAKKIASEGPETRATAACVRLGDAVQALTKVLQTLTEHWPASQGGDVGTRPVEASKSKKKKSVKSDKKRKMPGSPKKPG